MAPEAVHHGFPGIAGHRGSRAVAPAVAEAERARPVLVTRPVMTRGGAPHKMFSPHNSSGDDLHIRRRNSPGVPPETAAGPFPSGSLCRPGQPSPRPAPHGTGNRRP